MWPAAKRARFHGNSAPTFVEIDTAVLVFAAVTLAQALNADAHGLLSWRNAPPPVSSESVSHLRSHRDRGYERYRPRP